LALTPLITLLTDFGLQDSYVAEMKAVVFSICPDANLVDITHHVGKFNIRMGAFILASATPYFPPRTIHLAVVDPGVGSDRRAIAIESSRSLYVGPDNGLLIPAATAEEIRHVYELTNHSLMRNPISSTFQGRDIFSPVAANLALGLQPKEVGREITDYVNLSFEEAKYEHHGFACEVLHIDGFGNVITNINQKDLNKLQSYARLVVRIGGRRFSARVVRTFSELRKQELGVLIGSHGLLEIASLEANAAHKLRVKIGDALRVGGA
jgi:S-adenosylmethionine hydrolase